MYIQRCREYISDYDEGIKQQLASIDMESKLYIAIQCIYIAILNVGGNAACMHVHVSTHVYTSDS